MSRRHRPLVFWGVCLGGALLLGVVAGALQGLLSPAMGGVALSIAAFLGLGLSWVKWRELDEAAREAHKAAWFWGGCAALCVVGGVYIWLARTPDLTLFQGRRPGELVALGIGICVMAQLIGYGVAWAGWWLRRR